MKEIDLINLANDKCYIDLETSFLRDLIMNSKLIFGSQLTLAKYCNLNNSAIYRWLGRDNTRVTKPSYGIIKKLAKLNKIQISNLNKRIKGIKFGKDKTFLDNRPIKITPELCRVIGFIKGDGNIGKKQIRFSNSDKLVVKSSLSDFINSFHWNKKPYLILTVPSNFDKRKTFAIRRDWENYLNLEIDRVYKKHKTFLKGHEFISKKEYVEVNFISLSLSILFKKIEFILKSVILNNKNLAIAYLQGIYAAEGSVYYNPKNRLRMIQLNMKNFNEVCYIVSLLNFLDIKNSGVRDTKKGVWYVYISDRGNIEKCNDFGIFEINKYRKERLSELIKGYKRRQIRPLNKENRFLQIRESLERTRKVDSLILSNILKMSLNRMQVLLKKGFEKGKWERLWDGEKFIYFLK